MVRNLLDLTRGRLAGGLSIQPRKTDARDLLAQIIGELRASAPTRSIRFVDSQSVPALWDPDRILQLFGNLIGNAIKHSPAESPIVVELSSDSDEVSVAVGNQGPPIPEEQVPHLFKPFHRGTVGKSTTEGLGLGLYICHLIVAAHGGRIGVRSSTEGTVFTVSLPRSVEARPAGS
jgi:signal transduction histidine kinase